MNEKTVSVIVPTYKRADMLEKTIESILKQDYKDLEIIVVDDNEFNSEDRKLTEYKMEKYKNNSKIKYIKHRKNLGGCAARNTGIDNSTGEYICFLDDDDILYKSKISKQVEFMEENKQFGISYCWRKVGNYIHCPTIEGDISYYLLSGKSIIVTMMLMFKRECINGIMWNTKLRRNQEAGFILEVLDKGVKAGCLKEVLCETNLEDRKNALNSFENEKEFINYLNIYSYIIDKQNNNIKNARKKIYARRYVSILLNYLKEKKIKCAIKCFLKGCKISFNLYNYYLLGYMIKRVFGVKRDYKKIIHTSIN